MSELTPERIRDAAAVVRLVNEAVGRERDAAQYGSSLDTYALTLQLKLDAEAKREKRIEELAVELRDLYSYHSWRHLADVLLTRYPALAEGSES